MQYPLGQFPRYGHQERMAQERRERAVANSVIARQNQRDDILEEIGAMDARRLIPTVRRRYDNRKQS